MIIDYHKKIVYAKITVSAYHCLPYLLLVVYIIWHFFRYSNIARMKQQLKELRISFDWDKVSIQNRLEILCNKKVNFAHDLALTE